MTLAWKIRTTALIGTAALILTGCVGQGAGDDTGEGTIDPGVDVKNKTITIGGWRVESGPTSHYVIVNHAVDAAYRAAEESGELSGWDLKLVQPDTGGEPARSLQVTKDQIQQDQIFALNFPVGSAANAQVVPYVGSTEVPYIAPSAAGDQFMETTYPNVFPLIPPYAQMGPSLGVWAAEELGTKEIAVVYQNDSLGKPVAEHIDAALEKAGAEAVIKEPFDISDVDVATMSQQILNAKPDAVLFWGDGSQMMKTKQQVMAQGLDVPWLSTFFNSDASVLGLNEEVADGIYFQSQYEPFSSDSEAVKEFQDAMAKYYPDDPPNGLALSGWAGAQTLLEALKPVLASGEPPTREALMEELNSWTGKEFSVVPGLSFSEDERTGITKQYIVQYEDGEYKLLGDPQTLADVGTK